MIMPHSDSVGMLASMANKLLLHSAMPTAKQIATWDRLLVRPPRLADPLIFYTIGKSVLAHSLRENHDLVAKLSALLAKRQMETEGIVSANTKSEIVEAKQTEYTNGFMKKLSAFFEL